VLSDATEKTFCLVPENFRSDEIITYKYFTSAEIITYKYFRSDEFITYKILLFQEI
jgi:hypothetical protein